MGNIDLFEVKKAVNSTYKLLDTVESIMGKPDGMDISLRDCFRTEMIMTALYFSATDGRVVQDEVDMINEVFDYHLSIRDCINLIQDRNIYSTDFENSEKITLLLLKEFDKKYGHLAGTKGVPIVLELMENFAKALLVIDGDVDENEKEEFFEFFAKQKRKYMEDDTLGGIRKSTSSSDNSLKDYYLKKKR